jgi:hypothetical protein
MYYMLHLPTRWPIGAKNGAFEGSCAKPETMHVLEIERYWRLQSASQTLQGLQKARSLVTPGQDHDLYRLQVLSNPVAGWVVDGQIRYDPGEPEIQRAKLQSPVLSRTIVVDSILTLPLFA